MIWLNSQVKNSTQQQTKSLKGNTIQGKEEVMEVNTGAKEVVSPISLRFMETNVNLVSTPQVKGRALFFGKDWKVDHELYNLVHDRVIPQMPFQKDATLWSVHHDQGWWDMSHIFDRMVAQDSDIVTIVETIVHDRTFLNPLHLDILLSQGVIREMLPKGLRRSLYVPIRISRPEPHLDVVWVEIRQDGELLSLDYLEWQGLMGQSLSMNDVVLLGNLPETALTNENFPDVITFLGAEE